VEKSSKAGKYGACALHTGHPRLQTPTTVARMRLNLTFICLIHLQTLFHIHDMPDCNLTEQSWDGIVVWC